MRYVDIGKPGQTGEPFLHHRWIETYTAAVTDQLRAQDNLVNHRDPGQWADRAAYYWASLLHAHPYREGNGRSARIWIDDLAEPAGHHLDWTRSSPEHNVHVAVATAHGDYEPMRALLTVVAGGTVGTDPIDALNDHDKLQHDQAWARTGMVFGSDAERATLSAQLAEMGERLGVVRFHLDSVPERATTIDQPAAERWRVGRVDPARPAADPRLAALRGRARRGCGRGDRRRRRAPPPRRSRLSGCSRPGQPRRARRPDRPRAAEHDAPPPDADLVAAAYRPSRPPAPGPRR